MKTRLTTKEGEVEELTEEDVRGMQPMDQALPEHLQRAIRQRGSVVSKNPQRK
ncbi:hypothetical protein [Halomonas sp. PR-M31]|uniref:hypothetical protein n=1 Tax=Halomonas sp. PR-M31 TaxID=1471202 RepID=UPI0012E2F3C2|nr:hypothetical protein [Halomonas sp. PR-M31]